MLNNRVVEAWQAEKNSKRQQHEKKTARGISGLANITVHPQQTARVSDTVHTYVCMIRRKSPRGRSRAGRS